MPDTLELVRYTVSPDRREQHLALRPAAIAALGAKFGGLIETRLAEHDDGSFVDVVRWSSREEAERAAATCMEIPAVSEWMQTIESVIDMAHATVLDER